MPEPQMPDHLVDEANWEQRLVTDSQRILNELGYTEIVPPDEGLRKTIDWERANPPGQIDASQFNYKAEDTAFERKK